ncbi:helix-hairpin-helix domain-containing protein [Nocardiopsis metallicus]|uniref:Exodeoxyribonuclease V alpha subunit n=1 Tax=Nocardiopsis metallicus TaxID=179819 RepID=A0A840W4I6_9ACTN|nr:helix-hairpin-helix domain-containing protein [Nocardiopsis metallicus]MBB5490904.1 exodeoxyribonuclease V alpha subunit [Nocardiopsis metallicus]
MSEAVEKVSAVLDRMGAPRALAPRLVSALGPQPAAELDANPWLLLRLPGVTMDQADYCARKHLGDAARPDDPRRLGSMVGHAMRTAARRGHTAIEEKRLATVVGQLGVNDPGAAIEAAVAAEEVALFESTDEPDDDFDFEEGGAPEVPDLPDPERFYAPHDVGHAEQRLGEQLLRLMGGSEPIMDPVTAAETLEAATSGGGFEISETTREALLTATMRPVTVVHHGPGDQTETARALLCLAAIATESQVGIAVVAPTAQTAAAVNADLDRLLGSGGGAGQESEAGETESAGGAEPDARHSPLRAVSLPAFLAAEPAPAGIVVLCESMSLGVARTADLVSSCADDAHLVLLADPDQAPSATPGRVVADVATSRTAHVAALADDAAPSPVSVLAGAVAEGGWPQVEAPGREVVQVPAASAEEAAHRVVQLVTDSIPRALGIDADQVQIVTAREDGPAGARSLNTACKEKLNPGPGAHGGFDVGDRVVLSAEGTGYGPGDTGYLREVSEGAVIELTGGARVTVTDPSALRPGWAVSVAVAHGSRWPAVVAVFPPRVPVSRPQVYTALTRTTRHVSVVDATEGALETGVRETLAPDRTTRLALVLREG